MKTETDVEIGIHNIVVYGNNEKSDGIILQVESPTKME